MSSTVLAALIAAGTSLVVTLGSGILQRRFAREDRADEQRSKARVVLDKYRGPLLHAASDLGSRVDKIRNRDFLDQAGIHDSEYAKLSTLFRVAQYCGWREVLRREVQLMRFDRESDTQAVAAFIGFATWSMASDKHDGTSGLIWPEQQRGIGELMLSERPDGTSSVCGFATFRRSYREQFAPWMEDVASAWLSDDARRGDRLAMLQLALYGLVSLLDEECLHRDRPWFATAREEATKLAASANTRLAIEMAEALAELPIRDARDRAAALADRPHANGARSLGSSSSTARAR
jgi:hypothetical protein